MLNKMKRKGINYDIGIKFSDNYMSRPFFNTEIVYRELEIIKNDLHCNAIRISGTDIDRLKVASEKALELGFEVWLSPHLHDCSERETNDYTIKCALMAEELRLKWHNVVFILGCELTLFMNGILEGNTIYERISTPNFMKSIKSGVANKKLNTFLRNTCDNIRNIFKGKITYCSAPLEGVDWSMFDFVCLDYYREQRNKDSYTKILDTYFSYNKPVIISEVGCCTYKGAEDVGGRGFMIIDQSNPKQLNGTFIRDENVQAREIEDLLMILGNQGIEGIFVFTFVSPALSFNEVPMYDLDMASFSIVKSYDNKHGTTYSDMPWEPKESFYVIANKYNR
jgi:hypothetical protein